ncbi:hypothetical protein TNCV_3465091 [Trichonephila clavipes]|nr:hypothetical protein TNCV_3465091 [Trichonephila clavipes]
MLQWIHLKSVSPPRDVKKNRKTRIKESGVQSTKKKRSNLSKKLHDMGDDVMDIHASQSDESLMDDLSPRPSSSGSLRPSGGSPSLGECGFHAPEVPQ